MYTKSSLKMETMCAHRTVPYMEMFQKNPYWFYMHFKFIIDPSPIC